MSLSSDDRAELRQLVDTYALNCDAHDGPAVADLFAPDGRMLVFPDGDLDGEPAAVRQGRDALAAGAASLTQFVVTSHLVGQQVLVPVDENHARGVVYCTASHVTQAADGSRSNTVVHLRYHDSYVRGDRGWRFAERRACFDFIETRVVEGAFPGTWTR